MGKRHYFNLRQVLARYCAFMRGEPVRYGAGLCFVQGGQRFFDPTEEYLRVMCSHKDAIQPTPPTWWTPDYDRENMALWMGAVIINGEDLKNPTIDHSLPELPMLSYFLRNPVAPNISPQVGAFALSPTYVLKRCTPEVFRDTYLIPQSNPRS